MFRSSNSIVGHAVVYILRLIGHTHDRESPIQNFSTAPKKLGAHISSPVWPPKPTEFVSFLGNLRCDAFTALKSVQSARNESFLAGSDNFHRVLTAIEFEAWLVEQHCPSFPVSNISPSHTCAARLVGMVGMAYQSQNVNNGIPDGRVAQSSSVERYTDLCTAL